VKRDDGLREAKFLKSPRSKEQSLSRLYDLISKGDQLGVRTRFSGVGNQCRRSLRLGSKKAGNYR
jgi:hypothetical protein